MDRSWEVAVVGATGVVGRELVGALAQSGHPAERVRLLASERSAGEELSFGDETLEVETANAERLRGVRLAFLATPADVSRTLAQVAEAAGARVIDTSRAFLSDLKTPVVFPRVPGAGMGRVPGARRFRVPGPVSQVLLTCLEPLRAAGSELLRPHLGFGRGTPRGRRAGAADRGTPRGARAGARSLPTPARLQP